MAKYVIGITGEKGKGKTSFVHVLTYLLSINGYAATVLNFADYIKKIARECFGKDIGRIHGKLSEEERQLLCSIGDALRGIDANCLINVVCRQIDSNDGFIIIGDVRLKREADIVHDYNGILVKIGSSVHNRNENYLQNHITEQEIANIQADFLVVNEGTFSDLIEEAKKVLSHFIPDHNWKS